MRQNLNPKIHENMILEVCKGSKWQPRLDNLQSILDEIDRSAIAKNDIAVLIFLAQTMHESANFTRINENLKYRPKSLMGVSKNRFPTMADAEKVTHPNGVALTGVALEKAVGRALYGFRKDLGNMDAESGYIYRGFGAIQLTGRHNFETVSKLLNEPKLLTDPESFRDNYGMGVKVSLAWFLQIKPFSDRIQIALNQLNGTFDMAKKVNASIGRIINMGRDKGVAANGEQDRNEKFEKLYKLTIG